MLYNSCTGIYKFGNNTYPRRIRRRSNLGHIFRKKSASYGPGNTVIEAWLVMSAFLDAHHSILKSPLLVCNISETCPINSFRNKYFEIHFNITLISRPGSLKRSPQAQFKKERNKLATVKFPNSTPRGTWKSSGSFTHLMEVRGRYHVPAVLPQEKNSGTY
jgi:hypothetical protein